MIGNQIYPCNIRINSGKHTRECSIPGLSIVSYRYPGSYLLLLGTCTVATRTVGTEPALREDATAALRCCYCYDHLVAPPAALHRGRPPLPATVLLSTPRYNRLRNRKYHRFRALQFQQRKSHRAREATSIQFYPANHRAIPIYFSTASNARSPTTCRSLADGSDAIGGRSAAPPALLGRCLALKPSGTGSLWRDQQKHAAGGGEGRQGARRFRQRASFRCVPSPSASALEAASFHIGCQVYGIDTGAGEGRRHPH